MRKHKVLLLGWDFLPSIEEKHSTGCYSIAQALAKRVNLEVLLPHTDPAFILPNAQLTGLNQVDLEVIQATAPQPPSLPYADETHISNDIPLYGSVVAVKHSQYQAEQQQTTGTFTAASTPDTQAKKEVNRPGQPNLFANKDFEVLSLDAQVIQFARFACRWAAQGNFDLIYAYNYLTFLAGTELKLVSGKKLILQVDALSYERRQADNQGWLQEIEKQALQKCDQIFTNTDYQATILAQEYGLSPAVVKSLERVPTAASPKINALVDAEPVNSAWGNFAPLVKTMALEKEQVDWQQTADTIWEVMHKLATC